MEPDLEYDLGNLLAADVHPTDVESVNGPIKEREKYLRARATKNVQLLVKQIFALDSKQGEFSMMAQLPAPGKLPREKPAPAVKEPTRWEQFAQEKGIMKRKRSRMVFDEATETWRPRFGYKKESAAADWCIEVKDGEDIFVDKFAEKRLAKKKRVLQNQMNQIANLERLERATSKAHQQAPVAPSGIATTLGQGRPRKGTEGSRGKRGMSASSRALAAASVSTASLGQFDKVVDGEQPRKNTKRRRYRDNNINTKERDRQLMNLALSGKTGLKEQVKAKRNQKKKKGPKKKRSKGQKR
jgi:regulator of ribosome biosynthesis